MALNLPSKRYIFLGYLLFAVAGALLAMIMMSAFYRVPINPIASAGEIPEKLSYSSTENSTDNNTSRIIERTLAVLAISSQNNAGSVQNLTVKVIPGDGNVLVETNPFVGTDLQYSLNLASKIAKNITGDNETKIDLVYSYNSSNKVTEVGGGSGGAAETIVTIAALDGKEITPGVAITGTINPDGSIGQVRGIPEKAKAAADAGYKLLLVPEGQSVVRNYETVITTERKGRVRLHEEQYIVTIVNVTEQAEKWGMEVKEVSNIRDVMEYMIK